MTAGRRALHDGLDRLRRSVGRTPVLRLAHDTLDLYVKLESNNPNGSAKDRSAFWMLKNAVERGDITEGTTVVESSSGNFALSMAVFCRALDLDFVPVIDPNCSALTERQLRTLCRRVEKVTTRDASGGYLRTRLSRVDELRAELAPVYWPNQYANLDAVEAHYRSTGGELCQSLRRLDYLFVGVSTGGTIAGLSRRVKETYPGVRVVAVDAEGSAIFGQPPRARLLPGLGSSIVPPICAHALIDDVVIVSEVATIAACHRMYTRHGLFAGGSTGTVYAAIQDYFADWRGPRRPTVAFLCADRGTGYVDTVYNPAWVAEHYGDPLPERRPADAGVTVG